MAAQSRTLKLSILGDVDQLKKSLNTGSAEVQGFGSKISDFGKKAGLAFAVAGAAAAAYAGKLLIDGVKSAIADEAAQAKLATTLENVTGATRSQIKATESYITKTALANGITDDELRPSLDRLVRSTKSVEEAQKLQTLALNVSAGSGKSLEAVTNALAKAAEGNTTALGKLGVGLSAADLKTMSLDQVTKSLAQTFEGQAAKQADTFAGKMARLNVAFDEAKETVGSYVLDAITPLISSFVNKGIPAVTDFANNLGKTLKPAFTAIFTIIRDDVLPIIKKWIDFLTEVVYPGIANIVKPVFEGLVGAFNTIKKAVTDNQDELRPLLSLFKSIAEFARDTLAPILGGAFKLALQAVGTVVAGLVRGFSSLVGFITSAFNKISAFVNFVKNNPVTQFFFGGSNSKGLVAGGGDFMDLNAGTDFLSGGGGGGGINVVTSTQGGTRDIGALSAAQQAAVLRSIALQEETERLRKQREAAAAARLAATGGLSTADRITINVNGALDAEGTARTIVDTLNDSFFRGTNGASNFRFA